MRSRNIAHAKSRMMSRKQVSFSWLRHVVRWDDSMTLRHRRRGTR
ncbi:hypothetical protein RISK_003989 [Rhodopirellula islandica]|uniref:Uncharacterized protein n=1 Tax=Rhodopirellula islandica TaxID=595434 RepID=A0A0J1BBJ7_RHOIS|nr:hypothetical protein RISK_003989 [Rhodopirellula islandica]